MCLESVKKVCPAAASVDEALLVIKENSRTATKTSGCLGWCTVIGNTPLPQNKVTSWSIKILKSWNDDGSIFIGVAPFDRNQNEDRKL